MSTMESDSRLGFWGWIRSSHGAWALLSALLPVIAFLMQYIVSELFFPQYYTNFSAGKMGIVQGVSGFPVVAGRISNSGAKTTSVDMIAKCFAGDTPNRVYIGTNDFDLGLWYAVSKPDDLLEWPEASLAPGESGSFVFQLHDAEARNTPLPRKYAVFEIAESDIDLPIKHITCNRAQVIAYGTIQKDKPSNAAPIIFLGCVLIALLILGLRWRNPPAGFRWRHAALILALAVILLVVAYRLEITRLTPYPGGSSKAVAFLLAICGFGGGAGLALSALAFGVQSLVLRIARKRG